MRQCRPHTEEADLSAPVLAGRLERTKKEGGCKDAKTAFGGAVDPRNEVSVPKPAGEVESRPASREVKGKKGKKDKGKSAAELAAEAEAAKKYRGVCSAFASFSCRAVKPNSFFSSSAVQPSSRSCRAV